MNLNNAPTKEQLRQLLAQANDRTSHQILWVEKDGEVHLSAVPQDLSAVAFQQSKPEMQFRCETFQKGNEYVGSSAKANEEWVSYLFESPGTEWPRAQGKAELEFIELS
jgi:hypothetical protein